MKKKNILFPFDGLSLGGSHYCAIEIIEYLKKHNKYKPIVVIEKKGILSKILKKKNIKFTVLNSEYYQSEKLIFSNIYYVLKFLYKRIKFLNQNNISLIHTNEYRILNTWAFSSYIKKIKIIHHCRNPLIKSLYLKINLRLADYLIVISKFVKKTFEEHGFVDNVKLIYDNFKVIEANSKNKKYHKIKKIGFFGNFKPIKRPLFFLEICNKLLNDSKNFKFIYVGKINTKQKREIKKNFPNVYDKLQVIDHTFKPNNIIKKLDLLICPSVYEGFGRLPLEAASLGVLSLVSNHGGHKEYVNFGFCINCKTDDLNDFYIKIKKNLNFKKSHLLRKNVQKFILSNFQANKNLLKITDIYKKLIF